ncbi:hypothetical protein [Streptomyces sp. NRRL F-2580]|uniref:hypothetical protein n=1 Tax=Streptomyces sp. NRRL F-2580 TaxID=1463841 RepID=UPI0004CBE775|nr:hypothetical protein [Streptomyces sp. NRRL F-2580]
MTAPVTKVAWDHPPTAAGYRRLAFRRGAWLVGLTSTFVILSAGLRLHVITRAVFPLSAVIIIIVPFLPVVVIAYCTRRRVASVLQAYPWRELPCRHVAQRPSLIAVAFAQDFSPALRMFPFPVQLTDRDDGGNGTIWFAGDPRFGGVASPVGGHRPVRVVSDRVPGEGWVGGDDELARRAGLMGRNGKGTRT